MSGLKKIGGLDLEARRALLELEDVDFSQRKQCTLLGINRSGLYYEPKQPSLESLLLMRATDEEYLEHPYYGRRWMTIAMRKRGFATGQTAVRTAITEMGLEAIYPKPNLSKANKEHKKFPYLLRNLIIDHPDQAWAGDITYIPLSNGFWIPFCDHRLVQSICD